MKKKKPFLDPVRVLLIWVLYLNGWIFDGHDTWHDVHDPLRVDHYFVTQELVGEMLQNSQFVQELHRLCDLFFWKKLFDVLFSKVFFITSLAALTGKWDVWISNWGDNQKYAFLF